MRGTIELADGRRIDIRQLGPADRAALAQGFERLGFESRYLRFFGPMDHLSDAQLDYFTDVDHHNHEALVAIDHLTGDGIGVARFVRLGGDVAEPAVAVADDWQRQGVGASLLERLVQRAREEGIHEFVAPVLADNSAAIAAVNHLGQTRIIDHGRELEVRISLGYGPLASRTLRRNGDRGDGM